MSLPGVHVGFAALVTLLVLAPTDLPPARRWAVVVASGAWAVVPDLHHAVPALRPYKPLVHDSALSNLFWLHGVIDALDPEDRVSYSAAMVAAFLVAAVVVEFRRRSGEAGGRRGGGPGG